MKFQDSSFNSLKVKVGTNSVTHARTHALTLQKQYAPSTFSKLGGITIYVAPATNQIKQFQQKSYEMWRTIQQTYL